MFRGALAFCLLVVVVVVASSAPSSASAQRRRREAPMQSMPTDAERAAASERFDRGSEAASLGRWEVAAEAFRESYQLHPMPTSLVNLATALDQLGRLREAASAYRQYLAHRPASEIARYRRDVEERLAEVEARSPRLTVVLHGLFPNDVVELDGAPLSPTEFGVPQLVDPGEHVLVVRRGEASALRRTVVLAERARQSLDLDVPAVLAAAPEAGEAAGPDEDTSPLLDTVPDEPSSSITRSPWFWVGIGAGVAAVAATVVVVVLVTSGAGGDGPSGYQGNGSPPAIEF